MTMANMGKASTAVRKPKIKRAGISLRLKRDLTQARGIAIVTQSTAASAAQGSKRHLFVVDSLVSRIQKREIEPTLPAAQNHPRES